MGVRLILKGQKAEQPQGTSAFCCLLFFCAIDFEQHNSFYLLLMVVFFFCALQRWRRNWERRAWGV